jgi:hypothetical protein
MKTIKQQLVPVVVEQTDRGARSFDIYDAVPSCDRSWVRCKDVHST